MLTSDVTSELRVRLSPRQALYRDERWIDALRHRWHWFRLVRDWIVRQ